MLVKASQIKIKPQHMEALKRDLELGDERAFKELVAFLIVFGKPLRESLEKEIGSQSNETIVETWEIACEIGGAFSEKLKAFGFDSFDTNSLTWNNLIIKYRESTLKSYMSLVNSLLVAYGI